MCRFSGINYGENENAARLFNVSEELISVVAVGCRSQSSCTRLRESKDGVNRCSDSVEDKTNESWTSRSVPANSVILIANKILIRVLL